jgi:hypothetical protein
VNYRIPWRVYLTACAFFVFGPSNLSWAQTITLLSPNSTQATGISRKTETLTMVVHGRGFNGNHSIYWNQRALPTTFVSSTKLTAPVLPGAVYSEGTAEVTVGDSNGISDAAIFTVTHDPCPTLTSLLPSVMKAGGEAFRLSVVGINLPRFAVVQWNLSDRPTNYFSSLTVDAAISASDITYPGTVDILLIDGGISGAVSNTLSLSVMVSAPPPVIDALNPTRVDAGSGSCLLLVTGTNFTPTSVVRWNGANRETQFVDPHSLLAVISDGDVATPTQADITVMETAPGGSLSNTLRLIVGAAPALIFPQFVTGGGYSTTLTVVNIGNIEITGNLDLINKTGEPFFGITQANDALPKPASVVPISLTPGSMRVFKVDSPQSGQAINAGWARVEGSVGLLRGYATVQVRSGGALRNSSTVTNGDPMPSAEIPIDNDRAGDRYTGFTVTNFDTTAVNLKLAVFDLEGKLLEVLTPPELNPLKPQTQVSKFIHEYFSAASGTFKGSMVLYSPEGRNFVAAGLVQSEGLMSIIPALLGPYFPLP